MPNIKNIVYLQSLKTRNRFLDRCRRFHQEFLPNFAFLFEKWPLNVKNDYFCYFDLIFLNISHFFGKVKASKSQESLVISFKVTSVKKDQNYGQY
jgi:hypothetical protein